jgi:hypothetical protein
MFGEGGATDGGLQTDVQRAGADNHLHRGGEIRAVLPHAIGRGAHPDRQWDRLGELEINLLPNAAEPSPAEFPIHAMPILWLEVDDLAVAAERFARHGVRVVSPSDGMFMQVADPDGLVIEVCQMEPDV